MECGFVVSGLFERSTNEHVCITIEMRPFFFSLSEALLTGGARLKRQSNPVRKLMSSAVYENKIGLKKERHFRQFWVIRTAPPFRNEKTNKCLYSIVALVKNGNHVIYGRLILSKFESATRLRNPCPRLYENIGLKKRENDVFYYDSKTKKSKSATSPSSSLTNWLEQS